MATAPTYNMYSNLVDVATTQQFMKGVFEDVKQRNVILRLLNERNNIKYDATGKYFERNLRVGQHTVALRAGDLAARNFQRLQKYVTCAIPYAIKETTGALSEQDVMFNQGKEQLIPLTKRMFEEMSTDFKISLSTDLLQSNAGSNTAFGLSAAATQPVPFFGLPTMFGYGASATGYNGDTHASTGTGVVAGDKEVLPNQSYCGVSTHPTNAISGVDNKATESTSPVIVNWSSTAFSATTTWAGNCIKALNYTIDRTSRGTDPDEVADFGLMTRAMFTDLKNSLVQYYKIELSSAVQGPNTSLYKDNRVPFGNIDLYWDEAMPANVFYVLNSKKLEFVCFPQRRALADGTFEDTADEMFTVRSKYSLEQGGHLAVATLAGQLWGNMKFHAAGYNFA